MRSGTVPSEGADRPQVRITLPQLALAGCALATLLGAWVLLGGDDRPGGDGSSPKSAAGPLNPGTTDLSGKRSVFDDDPAAKALPPAPPPAPPRPASPASPAPAGVPPAKGNFAVQVFQGDERAARALEQRLRAHGFDAQVVPGGDGGRTRVRVSYRDRAAAEAGARRLEREERLPTWIVPTPSQ